MPEAPLTNNPIARLVQSVYATVWPIISPIIEHFFHPLYRTTSKSSFGKLWASALLVSCMYYWWHLQKDIPETLEYMTQVLLLYVFSTKPVQLLRDRAAGKTSVSFTPDGSGATTPAAGTAAPATVKAAAPAAPAQDGEGA